MEFFFFNNDFFLIFVIFYPGAEEMVETLTTKCLDLEDKYNIVYEEKADLENLVSQLPICLLVCLLLCQQFFCLHFFSMKWTKSCKKMLVNLN